MSDHPNGISTKDHLVALIEQLKESLTGQITDLRADIKHMQTNFVTRSEHDLVVAFLKNELSRVERESRDSLRDHIDTQEKNMTKVIGVTALVSSILIGLMQVVISIFR